MLFITHECINVHKSQINTVSSTLTERLLNNVYSVQDSKITLTNKSNSASVFFDQSTHNLYRKTSAFFRISSALGSESKTRVMKSVHWGGEGVVEAFLRLVSCCSQQWAGEVNSWRSDWADSSLLTSLFPVITGVWDIEMHLLRYFSVGPRKKQL